VYVVWKEEEESIYHTIGSSGSCSLPAAAALGDIVDIMLVAVD
jgi:hypothetical protein